jgi:predicted transposase/invertase (TIGR01784 family)
LNFFGCIIKKDVPLQSEKGKIMAKKSKYGSNSKRKSHTVSKVDKGLGIFINPRSDFGFKRMLGNANMMKSFLNNIVFKKKFVKSLNFLPTEHFGESDVERVIISDTNCEIQNKENILVEMQNAKPKNFIERLFYYMTYLMRYQMPKKGSNNNEKNEKKKRKKPWDYELKTVYIVAIVNFPMLKDKRLEDIVTSRAKFIFENTGVTFSDKLNIIIVDLTKFNKKEDELKTEEDFWLYTLKYAEKLSDQPEIMKKNKTFNELYDILSTNKLTSEEMKTYNDIVINMETMSLFIDEPIQKAEKRGERRGERRGEKRGEERGVKIGEERGEERGVKIGEEKGIKVATVKFVHKSADKGFSAEEIADITDLTVEQVRNILKDSSAFELSST